MATSKPKDTPPAAKKEPAEKSDPVIVLGPRDALDNMPATIDGRNTYVYRSPAGVWKSVTPAGRRKLGQAMSAALEAVYNRSLAGVAPISALQDIDEKVFATIGLMVIKSYQSSAYEQGLELERPWTEIEVNPLLLIQRVSKAIERALN